MAREHVTARAAARPNSILALVASALLALAAIALGSTVLAPAALAHDTLLSSDPEDGAVLETSPEQITLGYSADLLKVSPLIRVVDDQGATVLEQAPEITGPDAVLPLKGGLAPGSYEVLWRVVSSDGHPIEGSFSFEVTGGNGTLGADSGAAGGAASSAASDGGAAGSADPASTTEPSASDAGGATASPGAGADAATDADAVVGAEEGTGLPLPLLIGGAVILLLAIAAAVATVLRSSARSSSHD